MVSLSGSKSREFSTTSTRPAINAWTWWYSILGGLILCTTWLLRIQSPRKFWLPTASILVQEQIKERRYRNAATLAGMLLHGLAIEVYGAWGNVFTKMFTHFVSLGAVVTHIPKVIIANYWRRRISVCLQRGVANAINARSNRLTARILDTGSSGQGEFFFPGLVEEQSCQRHTGTDP